MKDLKKAMKDVRLSDEKKKKMIENIKNAENSQSKRTGLRYAGILSSAAALIIIAIAAVVFSSIPGRNNDIIEKTDKSSELSEREGEVPAGTSQSSSFLQSGANESVQPSADTASKPAGISKESTSKPAENTQPEPSPTEQSTEPEPSPTEQSTEPEPSLTEQSTEPLPQVSGGEAQMKTISLIVPDETELVEYAGDMHRPEGYNENIGSGLALKLEITKDSGIRYAVIIRIYRVGLADVLSAVGAAVDEDDISGVIINGADLPSQNTYFARLTAGQIISLAENGARLSYVGSGTGDVNMIGFDTPEGIESYVELNGDNYVFQGNEIRAYPDLSEEIIKPSLPTG